MHLRTFLLASLLPACPAHRQVVSELDGIRYKPSFYIVKPVIVKTFRLSQYHRSGFHDEALPLPCLLPLREPHLSKSVRMEFFV